MENYLQTGSDSTGNPANCTETAPEPTTVEALIAKYAGRPDGVDRLKAEIVQDRVKMAQLDKSIRGVKAVVSSLELFKAFEFEETYNPALQKNDCSRIHKLDEAARAGLIWDAETLKFGDPDDTSLLVGGNKIFVVRHDWARALGDSLNESDEFRLPYDRCCFEFRVMGQTILMMVWDAAASAPQLPNNRGHIIFFEGVEGVWFTMPAEAVVDIGRDLMRQVRAICVVLDAKVAEHQVVRAPLKLNQKREKAGRTPLRDFYVVDLSRRLRAIGRGSHSSHGAKVRMHFRRGHWRHYEDHKSWINWMLVGDPDLGFIDKHYRM